MAGSLGIPTTEELIEALDQCRKVDGFWQMLPVWSMVSKVGRLRDEQKIGFTSTDDAADGASHKIGLLAETVIYLETGLLPDYSLKVQGDGGVDFNWSSRVYDIKGSRNHDDPHLKQYLSSGLPKGFKHPDVYILVHTPSTRDNVKVPLYKGRVVGWATPKQLMRESYKLHRENGEKVEENYGRGRRVYLTEANLASWQQLGLPKELPTREEQ